MTNRVLAVVPFAAVLREILDSIRRILFGNGDDQRAFGYEIVKVLDKMSNQLTEANARLKTLENQGNRDPNRSFARAVGLGVTIAFVVGTVSFASNQTTESIKRDWNSLYPAAVHQLQGMSA